jgi:hypothetical protein
MGRSEAQESRRQEDHVAKKTSTTRPGVARAEQIVEANDELVAFIETCSDQDWARMCAVEAWPVSVVAHHVAWGHEVAVGWIRTIRSGNDVPGSPELHNAGNETKAASVAGISRDEVIALAKENVDAYADLLRTLTDEDLAKSAAFGPAGGMPMSVDRLAGARRHLDGHLGSMRAAVGR